MDLRHCAGTPRTADGGDVEDGIGAMVPGQVYSTDAPIKLRGSPAGG